MEKGKYYVNDLIPVYGKFECRKKLSYKFNPFDIPCYYQFSISPEGNTVLVVNPLFITSNIILN